MTAEFETDAVTAEIDKRLTKARMSCLSDHRARNNDRGEPKTHVCVTNEPPPKKNKREEEKALYDRGRIVLGSNVLVTREPTAYCAAWRQLVLKRNTGNCAARPFMVRPEMQLDLVTQSEVRSCSQNVCHAPTSVIRVAMMSFLALEEAPRRVPLSMMVRR